MLEPWIGTDTDRALSDGLTPAAGPQCTSNPTHHPKTPGHSSTTTNNLHIYRKKHVHACEWTQDNITNLVQRQNQMEVKKT